MTLIANEIYFLPNDPTQSRILCGADSMLTRDGQPSGSARKLFKIPKLNATVSYFGLHDLDHGTSLEDFLCAFITRHGQTAIRDFAHRLMDELNAVVPKRALKKHGSGLHVCGFNGNTPEFWFIRNIHGMQNYDYVDFREEYFISEELRLPHYYGNFFDEQSQTFWAPIHINFANGDVRTFRPAWDLFDAFSRNMDQIQLSSPPVTAEDHQHRLEWKMRAIGAYYELIAAEKIIGEPIYTEALTP